jgi:hypothetical protein
VFAAKLRVKCKENKEFKKKTYFEYEIFFVLYFAKVFLENIQQNKSTVEASYHMHNMLIYQNWKQIPNIKLNQR